MKSSLQFSLIIGWVLCSSPVINNTMAQTHRAQKHESVRLSYELYLSECHNSVCNSKSVISDQKYISLDIDPTSADPTNAWGYSTAVHSVGITTYYFRLLAVHDLKGRHISIGYSGRQASPSSNSKQVTWAEKAFDNTSWKKFPIMSVAGQSYSDGDKVITPKLVVRVIVDQ
jgi:hypothetical protein